MPWDVSDVKRFKKGLTDKQKKQWVEIANAALKSCQEKGGKNCEASAIRQASGVVSHKSVTIHTFKFLSVNNYDIRKETLDGKVYSVVPVVMMVEGVHNGSLGPLLHLADDLGKSASSWDTIPVVVDHPKKDGQFISANTPGLEGKHVGMVFCTHWEDGLRADAWIEDSKLEEVSAEALKHINNHLPLEVSLGMYTDEEEVEGEWNGEHYDAIARNHRPDHLALLPGGVGACSWEDGCGIRINKEGGNNMETIVTALKEVRLAGYAVSLIANGDQGYRTLIDAAYAALRGMDTQDTYHYLEEVYDDSLIYSKSGKSGSKLYKQGYKVSDGVITFVGDPLEVRKEVKFVANSGMTRTKFNNSVNLKKEDLNMSDKQKPCCEDLVNELIANSRTKFKAEDKEWLLTLEEDRLQKLIPEKEKAPEPVVQATLQINAETVKVWMKESMSNLDDYLKLLPEEVADQIKTGLKTNQEQREAVVKEILSNTKAFTEDELKAMKTDLLVKTYKAVCKEQVDFSLNAGGGGDSTQAYGEILYPVGVGVKTDDKK
ncbi:MAG: hypothetical protein A2Y71_06240 [Bacteroidetes bacterium RBG_13_42_15]|nr:MAG: hypothetical protein A2Y71_06240 [Bacteroidetes bacterium RBG_13_42_15]